MPTHGNGNTEPLDRIIPAIENLFDFDNNSARSLRPTWRSAHQRSCSKTNAVARPDTQTPFSDGGCSSEVKKSPGCATGAKWDAGPRSSSAKNTSATTRAAVPATRPRRGSKATTHATSSAAKARNSPVRVEGWGGPYQRHPGRREIRNEPHARQPRTGPARPRGNGCSASLQVGKGTAAWRSSINVRPPGLRSHRDCTDVPERAAAIGRRRRFGCYATYSSSSLVLGDQRQNCPYDAEKL